MLMNDNISRSTLTESLIFGNLVKLHVYNDKRGEYWLAEGRVTGLSLESGSKMGIAARHFIVTLSTIHGETVSTYVCTTE